MIDYYHVFIAVAGPALAYCMVFENRYSRFLSMTACTFFAGVGFYSVMDAKAAII